MAATEETTGWLVGDDGRRWLTRAASLGGSDVQRAATLRRELSIDRAAAVLEQLDLRQRARAKFVAAERMFFTRLGLEQATDEAVAAYKAARFPTGVEIADLCCGIGGDLMALAGVGAATGVDRDPAVALIATANLAACGRQGNVVTEAIDAECFDAPAWHIDPDRRPGGRRSVRVENHEPGLELIERLLERSPCGAIKLAPGAEPPDAWRERAELEWISRVGECKQLVAWFDALAREQGFARATILARDLDTPPENRVLASIAGLPGQDVPLTANLGRYVHEPDAAVLAADLVGAVAANDGLAAVTPGIAYLTSDQPDSVAAIRSFEISEVMPFRLGPLKSWLAARGVGRLEIKKRGVDESPELLRKKLQLAGDNEAVLFLMPIERRTTAILARRLPAIENGQDAS